MRTSIGATLIVLVCLAAGCARPTPPAKRAWTVMGTFAAVSVPAADAGRLDAAVDAVQPIFKTFEQRLSLYNPTSELSRVNAAAGGAAVPVNPATRQVIALARRYAEATGGAFDPTVGPVVRAWGFSGGKTPTAVPDSALISNLLAVTGWQHIRVTDDGISLALPGMKLDLGGIAKGFAVDVAYEAVRDAGFQDALVDLGGNMRTLGHGRKGVPWTIGVRNPFDREDLVGVLRIPSGMAVATSGNYERFVTIAGKRYAHIFDPRTGRPVTGMAGVTVVSPTAVEADALSTSLFVLGPEASKPVLSCLSGNEAVFIPDEQPPRLIVTPGFRRHFTPAPEWAERITDW
jgi:thiamine biosynthesis lipoprotein